MLNLETFHQYLLDVSSLHLVLINESHRQKKLQKVRMQSNNQVEINVVTSSLQIVQFAPEQSSAGVQLTTTVMFRSMPSCCHLVHCAAIAPKCQAIPLGNFLQMEHVCCWQENNVNLEDRKKEYASKPAELIVAKMKCLSLLQFRMN